MAMVKRGARLHCIASVAFAVAAHAAPPAAAEAPAALLSRAKVLVASGRLDEALAILDPLLASLDAAHARETRAVYCASSQAETLLYMTMAATAKRDAVAVAPDWCDAMFLKAFVRIDRQDLAGARALLERAVEHAPQNAHYLNELGYVFQTTRDYPAALVAYRRAIDGAALLTGDRARHEAARGWRGVGYVQVERGEWADAEASYRKALEIDPADEKSKAELRYIAEKRPRPDA